MDWDLIHFIYKFFYNFYFITYLPVTHGIVINDIKVQNLFTIYRNNSNDTINLDCDYEVNNNEANLLVKWFKNNKLIYQWIRGHDPSVLVSLYK